MKKILFSIGILLLSGCTVLPSPKTNSTIYDFGVQQSQQTLKTFSPPDKIKSLQVTEISSPAWLNNTAIHYRLAYHNPAQFHAYANSRWAAAPAILLTQQVRNRIVANTHNQVINDNITARAEYVLYIELIEFSQVFDTTDASYVTVSLRTSLVERNSRKLLAQKSFHTTIDTPTANATGAVSALISASNQSIDELIEWLAQELPQS
ncbi:MAG: ABC-type transport auxiliary lipoprotein family protein [Pseudomonadota bacterium]